MGIKLLLLITVIYLMGLSQAIGNVPNYEKRSTSDVNYNDGINYESFVANINSSNALTLEQALELVPKELYNNYVLVYRSRSLQDASPLFPRAIVFGKSSKFIMAFNGHQKQKGFNNLEIIQFREKTHRWEFREITFLDGQKPFFSAANPKKCLECHQSPQRTNVDPRPNWEPYNFWPGVYASVDDKIQPTLKPEYEKAQANKAKTLYGLLGRFLPQDMVLIEEQSHEEDNLTKFTNTIRPRHDRYKHLSEFNSRGPSNITKSIVSLNMRRVARLMREDLGELFDIYKYTLLGLGYSADYANSNLLKYRCGDLYMPEAVKEKHFSIASTKRDFRIKDFHRPTPSYNWSHGLGAGIDVTLLPLGLQTDDWSMDFHTEGRFSVDDRFASPHHSASQFRQATLIVYSDDAAVEFECNQLKEESFRALTEFDKSGRLENALLKSQLKEEDKPFRPLIQRCISCHVNYEDGGLAPSIPFDNLAQLKPMLKLNKYKRGSLYDEILYRTSDHAPLSEQMPPGGRVNRKQRDDFIKFMSSLIYE